jgi:sugar O-acyltransferase (sialic acid O-acetyltransferase NeuD family)
MNTYKYVGIFGASGMAREAGDIAHALNIKPLYVVKDGDVLPYFIGKEKVIAESDVFSHAEIPYVIGIADGGIRCSLARRFKDSLEFTNLVHPTVTFGYKQRQLVDAREGTIIAAGVRFTSGISLGNFSIFNQNATIAHDCDVGDFVHVAPAANISGNVRLRNFSWIGAGAVVNQGSSLKKLEVGENTVVGSGAVVVRDCEANAVYVGVPARRIR